MPMRRPATGTGTEAEGGDVTNSPASHPEPGPAGVPPQQRVTPAARPLPRTVGLLLLLPMLAGTVYWLVIPSIRTVVGSLSGHAPTIPGSGRFSPGHQPDSFTGTGDALIRSLLLAAAPVLVMAIVVPLLAWAGSAGGSGPRVALRLLLTVPVAGFAPAVVAAAMAHGVSGGMLKILAPRDDGAMVDMGVLTGLAGLGLICGIGVAALLAALRRRTHDRPGRTVGGALTMWGVLILATLAVAVQSSTLVNTLTGGGPGSRTMTLPVLQYRDSFQYLSTGGGAAAGTVLLAVVGLLGLAAGLILIISRARFELDPERRSAGLLPASARPVGTVLAVVALLVVVGIVVLDLFVTFGLFTDGRPTGPAPSIRPEISNDALYGLLPAALSVLVQVPLAYLAGLGVGAFRPLGKRSEWLLLPFSPWLFVTVAPMMTIAWLDTRAHHHLDSVPGLVSPILVSVPALFLFALFAAGQERRRQDALRAGAPGGFARTILLPSLPLFALVTVVDFLVQAHDLFWPLLVNMSHHTAALRLMMYSARSFGAGGVGPILLVQAMPFALVALVLLALLQVLFLDRLAFRTGTDPVRPAGAPPWQSGGAPGQPDPTPWLADGLRFGPGPNAAGGDASTGEDLRPSIGGLPPSRSTAGSPTPGSPTSGGQATGAPGPGEPPAPSEPSYGN